MKKGKYVLIIGAVVVALLMVSSACAVNVVQSSNVKKSLESESDEVYIDPNIKLTRKHLTMLKKAVEQIEDIEIKEFLRHLNIILEQNGQITSNHIEKIIQDLGLFFRQVAPGLVFGSGSGTAACIPFVPIGFGGSHLGIIPAPFALWIADRSMGSYDISLNVNLRHYTEDHVGFAIIFFGICHWDKFNGDPNRSTFNLFGFSPLIIVK